jgi:hypothetical protein
MTTTKEIIAIYITKEKKEKIIDAAKKDNRSVSSYINNIISKQIKEGELNERTNETHADK